MSLIITFMFEISLESPRTKNGRIHEDSVRACVEIMRTLSVNYIGVLSRACALCVF